MAANPKPRQSLADTDGLMPTTITAAVADRLREEIRSGKLTPGSRLRQAYVAENYGVSTTPVREAFAALEREGLLQSSAHRGVVVFEPSAADLREIYEIRTPLESLATELGVGRLSEEDLGKLASLLKKMTAANRRRDWQRSGALNDEFHFTIYAAADRTRLFRLIAELRASSRAYIGLFPKMGDRIEEVEREHEAIYLACQAGKPKKAARAMVEHLSYTVEAISLSLEERTAS